MAWLNSATVVTPSIPAVYVSPLERLILSQTFTLEEEDSDGIAFSALDGPHIILLLEPQELRSAWISSQSYEGRINSRVAKALAEFNALTEADRPPAISIGVSVPETGWLGILQDVIRRSESLDEVVVFVSLSADEPCDDGFGGEVMRITAERIQYASTFEFLETMRAVAPLSSDAGTGEVTRDLLESAAKLGGWDSFTLLTLISRWLDSNDHTSALVSYLDDLAGAEDVFD